ncbi:hypothetical protein ACFRKB_11290 [Streptomyces scopuliridis]|uniref:hypothetical protein n=1 Tax=Streptomyces scopuliridis TaxID=452529 RepID=UPI0036943E98
MPDLPARLEAALTERFTELGNPYSRMSRHEKGPDGWPAAHPVGPRHVAEVLRELLAAEAQQPEPWLSDSARIGRALIWSWSEVGKGAFGEGYRAAQAEVRALLTGERGDAEESPSASVVLAAPETEAGHA